MVLSSELVCYRTGMADVLKGQVAEVGKIKGLLGVRVGDDASERAVLEDVPLGPFRLHCALLLHKAQMHMVAVLGANESNNLHSLAVQMRPVLECAGQIVLEASPAVDVEGSAAVIHTLYLEPERVREVDDYFDRDYLGTLIRATKGEMRHEQLLAQISKSIREEFDKELLVKARSLKQEDKVAPLYGGKDWYGFLSDKFCHGKVDWTEGSWQGGVSSNNTLQDAYAFAAFMDYLANQVAVMNAYAALQIPSKKALDVRMEIVLSQLQKVRAETKASRDRAAGPILATESSDDGEYC